VPCAVGRGLFGCLSDGGGGPAVGHRRRDLLAASDGLQEEPGLDGLEVVKSHRGASAGLEPGELAVAGAAHHGRVAVIGSTQAEADLQFVESLEVPANRAGGAADLHDVFRARPEGDAAGLEGAHRARGEPGEQTRVVLVLDRLELAAHTLAEVAPPRPAWDVRR
jgi:hypothetical protein